ncbi:MAG: hypothetical protein H7196_00970 [candidate division SR1 bacterium]|nr:hypothetical protein [candidate division SR1 bacterium]
MINRLISLQILRASEEINRQEALGWYTIDILSQSDNDDPTTIQNSVLKIKFARLNGDGISKWITIDTKSSVSYFGEL